MMSLKENTFIGNFFIKIITDKKKLTQKVFIKQN